MSSTPVHFKLYPIRRTHLGYFKNGPIQPLVGLLLYRLYAFSIGIGNQLTVLFALVGLLFVNSPVNGAIGREGPCDTRQDSCLVFREWFGLVFVRQALTEPLSEETVEIPFQGRRQTNFQ